MELANGRINKFFTLPDKGENRYYIDDFNADEDKYNNNVYLLSEHIPKKSVVLDIGCGSGKFGKKLKEKQCIVYGLERDSKAAECARNTGCYKYVFECDITEEDSNAYKEFLAIAQGIDVIILSDILEHLEDPTQLLLKCNQLLKEEGYILVSVPNVAHADISLNLLNGKFNYTDMGILDNTHLKFFTKNSFFEWINLMNKSFSEVNLDIEYIGGTFYNNEFLNSIKEEYRELYEVLQYAETYNNFQLLFKLSKVTEDQLVSKSEMIVTDTANNIVDILGKRLKGQMTEIINKPTLLKGERLEYEQQVKNLNKSISKQQQYINNIECGLEGQKEYIKSLESDIQKQQEYIKSVENDVENQQQYINSLESSVDEQRKYINVIDESLAWHKENDRAKSNQLKNQTTYEEALETSISWYKESIQEKEGQINEQLNYIAALKESVAWYEEQTKRADNENAEKDKYIKALEESIKWHETNREDIQKQIEEKNKVIEQVSTEKHQEVTKLTDEKLLLSEKIIQMERSICFKIYRFFNKN